MKKRVRKIPLNYMDIVFAHNEKILWRQKENGSVEIDMENRGFFNAVAQKFFNRPRISHIALDEYGTQLWLFIDGKMTVNDIFSAMKKSFPDESEKMLNRVVQFLSTLEKYEFIFKWV